MKTSIKTLHHSKSNDKVNVRKAGTNNFIKLVLVIFALSWMSLMSACMVSFDVPFHEGHYWHGGYGHHGWHH